MRYFFTMAVYLATLSYAPNMAAQIPHPVDKALTLAETYEDCALSFTLALDWKGEPPLIARYDAKTGLWTQIKGELETASKNAAKKFKNWKKSESAPCGLLYADYRPHLKNITLVKSSGVKSSGVKSSGVKSSGVKSSGVKSSGGESSDQLLTYAFTSPQTPSDLDKAKEVVETALIVNNENTDRPYLTTYRVRALKPFKPNPVARLEAFHFVQNFEEIFDGEPPLMTHVIWRAKGRRAFKNIDEDYELRFYDFEKPK